MERITLIAAPVLFVIATGCGVAARSWQAIPHGQQKADIGQIRDAFQMGSYYRCIERARAVSPESSSFVEAKVLEGKSFRKLNRWKQAELAYREAIGVHANNTEATWDLLDILYVEQRFTEARRFVFATYDIEPDSISRALLLLEIARQEYEPLGPGETAWLLEPVLVQEPDSYDAMRIIGRSYVLLGRVDQGIDLIQRSIRLAPNRPDAWLDLAAMYSRDGDLPAFERTLSESPDSVRHDPRWHLLEGQFREAQQQFNLAESAYRSALEKSPEDLRLYHQLAQLYRKQNKPEQALELQSEGEDLERAREKIHSSFKKMSQSGQGPTKTFCQELGRLYAQLGRERLASYWKKEAEAY